MRRMYLRCLSEQWKNLLAKKKEYEKGKGEGIKQSKGTMKEMKMNSFASPKASSRVKVCVPSLCDFEVGEIGFPKSTTL